MTRTKVIAIAVALLLAASLVNAAEKPYTRSVAIVIYDGVEVLDFAGPAEVFESAGHFGSLGGDHTRQAFKVFTVGLTKNPITSQRFLKVTPDYSFEEAPKADIIVLPGGGTGNALSNPEFMKWVKGASQNAELTLTVCTGAFILGKAGLLDGLDVTTWYNAVERLRTEVPNARVHAGRRFIDNGKYVTTAGVSAGIDGSLHVVARLLGRNVADQTARYMEYHWTPESHLASNYSYLNPSVDEEARTMQQAQIFLEEKNYNAAETIFRNAVTKKPSDHNTWMTLGAMYFTTKKYDQAIDAFTKASQSQDLKGRALYNAACVYVAKNNRDKAFELLDQALAALPQKPPKAYLESDPDLAAIRDDARFAKLIAGL